MKKKYIYIALASVISIIVIMGTLLFGTHIGKTVTEEDMKTVDNELTYNMDDIEGIWLARNIILAPDVTNSSYRLVKFTNLESGGYKMEEELMRFNIDMMADPSINSIHSDVEKLYDDSNLLWSEQGVLGMTEYNSMTRTFDSIFTPNQLINDNYPFFSTISVGKDAKYLTMTMPIDVDGKFLQQKYTMIRTPKYDSEIHKEINSKKELSEYMKSLFDF